MKTRLVLPLAILALTAGFVACDRAPEARAAHVPDPAELTDADMVVYKSPTCGCCDLWVDHARDHGFSVTTVDLVEYDALVAKKREHGVAMDMGSCHTTLVGGYVVEGHVPAHVIQRLLDEQPDIRGLAVPGMPIGSPGMEGPGARPYQVIAIGLDGSRSVYETVDPNAAPAAAQ
jgi:hypothetical protein